MRKKLAISLVCVFYVLLASPLFPSAGVRSDQADGHSETQAQSCGLTSTSAEPFVNGGTGSLRSDGRSATDVLAKVQNTIQHECALFSAPHALRQVRLSVGENHIVISGTVPSGTDEERLLSIVQAYADGRTVFNRLSSLEQSTKSLQLPAR